MNGTDKPNTFLPVSDNGQTVTKVVYNSSTDVKLTYYQQANKLKIGSSYTLTYGVKNLSAVGNCYVSIFLTDNLENLDNAVGITDFNSKDCSMSYYNEFSIQFTYPESFSGKNTYVVVMIVADKLNSGFQVTDFVFTNNDKSEEKIDGILEWLSAVYHGIVGGEDSRGVQHDGLVQGIKNGISSLGDRISGFFGEFGEKVSGFFDNLWSNLSSAFDSLKEKLTAIGDDIKAKFQEIADSFTEFFDKFKPRVYEEFLWYQGGINSSGQINPLYKGGAYTSEMFYIPSGSVFLLDFDVSNYSGSETPLNCGIYQYDADGNFIKQVTRFAHSGSFTLEAGFNYRFEVGFSRAVADNSSYELSKICNKVLKVYCDEGWVNALLHAFLNGLKQLFIPGPGFFDDKLDDFLDAYEDHFGIFAQATIYFTKAIQKVQSILQETYSFVFPELSITIQGQKYVFSEQQNVDIKQWLRSGTWSANLYEMYRVFASAFLIYLVLLYARKVEAVVLNNTPELAEEFEF